MTETELMTKQQEKWEKSMKLKSTGDLHFLKRLGKMKKIE